MRCDVLLIGGGHAHITALRWLKKHPCPHMKFKLVNPRAYAVYSGMVPGFVAGHFDRNEVEVDLNRLCVEAGVDIVYDSIVDFDPVGKTATGETGASYSFTQASIDVGIVSAPVSLSEKKGNLAVKPMSHFVEAWQQDSGNLSEGVAIIGGGLGGVELALAVRHKMNACRLPTSTPLAIVDRSEILSSSSPSLRHALCERLNAASVTIIENTQVRAHENGCLMLDSGQSLTAQLVLWTAGAHAPGWLEESGLETSGGFPVVNSCLQSISHPDIFISGDVASLQKGHIPKAGVYAVRQGPVLMQNLIAKLSGAPLQNYDPQKDYLKLVSLGARAAIAEKWGHTIQFPGLWGLKTLIDRSFVQD